MKISFATFLLVNGATAECDFDYKRMVFKYGDLNDLTVTVNNNTALIENVTDSAVYMFLPLKTNLSTNEPKCDFTQLTMWMPDSDIAFINYKS